MASQQPHTGSVGPDTLITVKVFVDGTNRRFKLALRDLGAHVLPQKLRILLSIPSESDVQFERFSDSAGTYIILDSSNPAVYKQLYRAAKAKLKLRLKATVMPRSQTVSEATSQNNGHEVTVTGDKSTVEPPRQNSYLETVLSSLPPASETAQPYVPAQNIPCTYPVSCAATVSAPRANPIASLSRATLPSINDFSYGTFSIDCNSCGNAVPDEHFHCGICAEGDFDLCRACVDAGVNCQGEDHWMIKRTIKNGRVYQSSTEILPPKASTKENSTSKPTKDMGADHNEDVEDDDEERTCNSCISQLPASSFVTCKDCPDFDLCYDCFSQDEHGHHPAHTFLPVDEGSVKASTLVAGILGPGRGLKHDAYCDSCDKQIVGVRHKCLSCPDFDFCSACFENAAMTHAGHRFAPLYEQLGTVSGQFRKEMHRGIYCDGPLCKPHVHKAWIRGDRYKCSVCEDYDLCENCEAIPSLTHNKTHPLIKIKTPIRFVSVSAFHEPDGTRHIPQTADRPAAKNASTETTQPISINAATQVQTVAEVKPVETTNLVSHENKNSAATDGLEALFESESTPDGTIFEPNHYISQSWTLRNPGPQTWPAGCAVYWIGGDDMRNISRNGPSSISTLLNANHSNVLEQPLEPNKTAVFTVLLKSPLEMGNAISYWRLKTPEGLPFGNKLWVDITVADKSGLATMSESAPLPEPFKMEAETTKQETPSMIFPKLEKESPESSIHDVTQSGSVTTTTRSAVVVEDDLIEDLESLELDEVETEDGFLTDEEYDILDADDEEFLEEAQRAVGNSN